MPIFDLFLIISLTICNDVHNDNDITTLTVLCELEHKILHVELIHGLRDFFVASSKKGKSCVPRWAQKSSIYRKIKCSWALDAMGPGGACKLVGLRKS